MNIEERTIPETVGESPCGREVWDADSIPFEVALEVVTRGMLNAAAECFEKTGRNPGLNFNVINLNRQTVLRGFVADCGWDIKSDSCDTPAAAVAEIIERKPNKKRIAELRAELAKLEEVQS